MKKFNLEEALAGKPVITRDGKEVTQLVKFDTNKNSEGYLLFGVVEGFIAKWTIHGNYFSNGVQNGRDLFMKTGKKSIWVNVYDNGKETWLGCSYDTKEGALINSYGDSVYIKTIEITNEK